MKRMDYLSWDEYFMGVAMLSAQRSKDPSTQVGACIANRDHKILSVGYNGMPTGCSDDVMAWERVCHAELNAILNNDGGSLKGAIIYVTLFPCNECAKAIIQSGIREVVYWHDKYADTPAVQASKRMFELAGVTCRTYQPSGKRLTFDF